MAVRVLETDPVEKINAEYGINSDYVLELLARYRSDPRLLDADWREYFARLLDGEKTPATAPKEVVAPAPAPVPIATPREAGESELLRGASLRIAQNMTASLSVPTATSQRQVPIKLLDENRRLINEYRQANDQSKISFTHLIAWAAVCALKEMPRLNDAFNTSAGEAERLHRSRINWGIAVDVLKKDGTRTLLVPNVKGAETMNLSRFAAAMEDVIGRARTGALVPEDFSDTTVSLTNPGPVGTTSSVARLMPGQGLILATGAIDFPPGFSAMAPQTLARLGVSQVMTLSCTYDHRIIQGAESGTYLGKIQEFLQGEHGFYDDIFSSLAVPYRPLRWANDNSIAAFASDEPQVRQMEKQARVLEMIHAYRTLGHLIADIDPLRAMPVRNVPELDIETYGLTIWDLDREFVTGGMGGAEMLPLRRILAILRRSYCGKVGVEYRFIQDAAEREWLRRRIGAEPVPPAPEVRKQILWKLISAEIFEKFLGSRFLGQKRFSIEGSETLIPVLDQLVICAGENGVEAVTIGMSHRGRLTVIANVIGHFCERIFASFDGIVHPDFPNDEGDVKYHRGAHGARELENGQKVTLDVVSNPSHLEFVDPVVEGMARARQDARGGRGPAVWGKVLPILIHGDAAFAGQGVVAETFNLSQLKGYRTGGTIHLVVNNQIGFTTSPDEGRSSLYSTDTAKINQVPIFHVNGDDPEAADRVMRIAFDYRQQFHKDVVIDLLGFRRHGHNEGDEPSYTQPLMYERVRQHPGVLSLYAHKLIREGVLAAEEFDALKVERTRRYEDAFERAKKLADAEKAGQIPPASPHMTSLDKTPVHTGIPVGDLEEIGVALTKLPADFHLNPKIMGQLGRRSKMAHGQQPLDWAMAEALAFGSLLAAGTPVRLSGEDSSRGTFSQRHTVFHDTSNDKVWNPLAAFAENRAPFYVFDSALSETSVLGFEYGYSVAAPGTLTLWEAQYGDFINAAQVIVDQFIASGEEKWGQTSRLVLLLPHGQEGQGPEHSSARLERFLQLSAGDNIQVCQPSTPAQYFHLLRRQILQKAAKPLVILTPKSLLRLPASFSTLEELAAAQFLPVIPDHPAQTPRRLLLTSGKAYYELKTRQQKGDGAGVAIARIEQFAPFPKEELTEVLAVSGASEVVWVQEEPANMGAWFWLEGRLREILPASATLDGICRPPASSPATGSAETFLREENEILSRALGYRR